MSRPSIPWARLAPFLLMAVIGATLWLSRPLTPFEWDEVLFMRALDHFDVATHSPHPPGYPVFVAAGHLARFVVGDPFASLQLVSVLATLGALIAVFLLVRRTGRPPLGAWVAATLLLTLATVLFHATTAYSDVLAMAVTALAMLAFAASFSRPGTLVPAAALGALALGVRPQLIAALLPVVVALTVSAIRARRWRTLAAAAGAGVAVTAACWIPAIAITGPARFLTALSAHGANMEATEHGYRLLSAQLKVVTADWLIAPFGPPALAAGLWLLVGVGSVSWWRCGCRRLVLITAGTATSYIVIASLTHNMLTTTRYMLPALPFLAVLAAGVTVGERPRLRAAGLAAAALLAAANVAWVAPALALRAKEPAPLWACLETLREKAPRGRTHIVFDGAFTPHVEYQLLGPRGRVPQTTGDFVLEEARPAVLYRPEQDRVLLFVFHEPIPGAEVVASRRWRSRPLRMLTRGRYDRCTISILSPRGPLWYSPDFRLNPDGVWVLSGCVALAPGGPPRQVRLRTLGSPVLITPRGQPTTALPANSELLATLWPDGAPSLQVAATTSKDWIRIAPLELLEASAPDWARSSAPPATEWFVPVAAHIAGRYDALWVTDLVLASPDGTPRLVRLEFTPRPGTSGSGAVRTVTVPAGTPLRLDDVVRSALASTAAGSLRIRCDSPLLALWRTYDVRARTEFWPPLLPAMTQEAARTEGVFGALPSRPGRGGIRSAVSLVDATGRGARVTVTLSAGSSILDRQTRRLSPFGCLASDIPVGKDESVRVAFTASDPVFVVATVTDNRTGGVSLISPD